MMKRTDKSIRFWDRIADRYSKQAIAEQSAYETKLEMTRKYLHGDASVLEFGCGTGSTALVHAPRVKSITAIDSSKRMVEIASAKKEAQGIDNVNFEQSTILDLPESTESYDVILGLNVLHLIPEMEATIERCYELLKPGGIFISSTACVGETNVFLRLILPIGGLLGLIPKVEIFRHDVLKTRLKAPGFEILDYALINKSGHNAFVIAQKP